jgi:hypothetical protein
MTAADQRILAANDGSEVLALAGRLAHFGQRLSRSGFQAFGEIAQSFAVCAVRNLMPQHHHNRQRPIDELKSRQQGEAGIPGKPGGAEVGPARLNAAQAWRAAALSPGVVFAVFSSRARALTSFAPPCIRQVAITFCSEALGVLHEVRVAEVHAAMVAKLKVHFLPYQAIGAVKSDLHDKRNLLAYRGLERIAGTHGTNGPRGAPAQPSRGADGQGRGGDQPWGRGHPGPFLFRTRGGGQGAGTGE